MLVIVGQLDQALEGFNGGARFQLLAECRDLVLVGSLADHVLRELVPCDGVLSLLIAYFSCLEELCDGLGSGERCHLLNLIYNKSTFL